MQLKKDDEDVNLYLYWQIIAKRKWLLFGALVCAVLVTTVINLSFQKIYGTDVVISFVTPVFGEVQEQFNVNEEKNIRAIFPKNFSEVDEIKAVRFIDELHPSLDSATRKLRISLDVKDTSKLAEVVSEMMLTIDNLPAYKKSVEELRETGKRELHEINQSIASIEEAMSKDAQNVSAKYLVELKSRKIFLEQTLKNDFTTEITYQYVYTNPVKPHIKRNVSLAAIISFLFMGIGIIVSGWSKKFNTPAST